MPGELQELNKVMADIWKESRITGAKEKKFDEIAKQVMEIKNFPYIIVRRYKAYRIFPILYRYISYKKAHTTHWTSVTSGEKGTTRHKSAIEIMDRRYDEGEVKVIKPKLWKRIKEIDDEIEVLRKKKHNLLKANFSRLPNLTLRKMKEIDNFKRAILLKLGLIKEV